MGRWLGFLGVLVLGALALAQAPAPLNPGEREQAAKIYRKRGVRGAIMPPLQSGDTWTPHSGLH